MSILRDKLSLDTMCSRILCSTIPLLHDEPDRTSVYNLCEVADYWAWKQGPVVEHGPIYDLLTPLRPIIRALLLAGYCVPHIALRDRGEHIMIWDTASLHAEFLSFEDWMHYVGQDGQHVGSSSGPAKMASVSTANTVYLLSIAPRAPSTIHGASRAYAVPLNLPVGTVANFNKKDAGWLLLERTDWHTFRNTQKSMCVAICNDILGAWNATPEPQKAAEAWMRGGSKEPLGLLPFIYARLYHPRAKWEDEEWSKSITTSPRAWSRVLWLGLVEFRSQMLEELLLPHEWMTSTELANSLDECDPDEEDECIPTDLFWSHEFNWSTPTYEVFAKLAGILEELDSSVRESWFLRVANEMDMVTSQPSADGINSIKSWLQVSFETWSVDSAEAAALSTLQEILGGRTRRISTEVFFATSFFGEPSLESAKLAEHGLFETLTKAEYELLNGSFFNLRRSPMASSQYAVNIDIGVSEIINSAEINFLDAIASVRSDELARIKHSAEFTALILDVALTIAIPTLGAGVLSGVGSVLVRRRLQQALRYQTVLEQRGLKNVKIKWNYFEGLAKDAAERFKATDFHKTSLTSATKVGSQLIKWAGAVTPTVAVLDDMKAQIREVFSFYRSRLTSMTHREAEVLGNVFAAYSGGDPPLSCLLLVNALLAQELHLFNVGKMRSHTTDASWLETLDGVHYVDGSHNRYRKLAFIRGTSDSPEGRLAYIEELDFLDWVDPRYAQRAIERLEAANFQVIMGLDAADVLNLPGE